MRVVATGAPVVQAAPVRGRWRRLRGPDDVLALLDGGADGVVAAIDHAGATFLAPVLHELTAVVCASGTPRSHVGIVTREFQVPCVMGAVYDGDEPGDGDEVEVDCSSGTGVVRAVAG